MRSRNKRTTTTTKNSPSILPLFSPSLPSPPPSLPQLPQGLGHRRRESRRAGHPGNDRRRSSPGPLRREQRQLFFFFFSSFDLFPFPSFFRPRPRRRSLSISQLPRRPRGIHLPQLPRECGDQLHVPLDRRLLQLFGLGSRAHLGRLLASRPCVSQGARGRQRLQLCLLLPFSSAGLGHVPLEARGGQAARAGQGW